MLNVIYYFVQSSQFVSNLEKFASDNGVGSGALKNLIKTVLIISFDLINEPYVVHM